MLLIDTNERGPIFEALRKFKIEYKRVDLDVDYTDERRTFVVERKTVADFKNSLLNQHLKKQCEYMAKKYPDVPKYILVEGLVEDAVRMCRKSGCVGLIESFFYRAPHVYNVHIIETVDVFGTAKALLGIMKYAPGATRLLEHGALEMPPKTPDPRIRTLMTLPGIGRKAAERLLKEYGSLMEIFTADITELKGFGKKTFEAIQDYLN